MKIDKDVATQPFNWVPKYFCGVAAISNFGKEKMILLARKNSKNPGFAPFSRGFDPQKGNLSQHWQVELISISSNNKIRSKIWNIGDLPLNLKQLPFQGKIELPSDESSIERRVQWMSQYFSQFNGVNRVATLPIEKRYCPDHPLFTKFTSGKMYAEVAVKDKYSRIALQTLTKEIKTVEVVTPSQLEELTQKDEHDASVATEGNGVEATQKHFVHVFAPAPIAQHKTLPLIQNMVLKSLGSFISPESENFEISIQFVNTFFLIFDQILSQFELLINQPINYALLCKNSSQFHQ